MADKGSSSTGRPVGGAGVMVMAGVASRGHSRHRRPAPAAAFRKLYVHPQAGKSTRTRCAAGAGQARASLVPAHPVDTGAATPSWHVHPSSPPRPPPLSNSFASISWVLLPNFCPFPGVCGSVFPHGKAHRPQMELRNTKPPHQRRANSLIEFSVLYV
jgi:hypothetical protein